LFIWPFKKIAVDEYFKKVREGYSKNGNIPINWRSLYLLIDNVIEKDADDIDIDDLEQALDAINSTAIMENQTLKDEMVELKDEIVKLKAVISEQKRGNISQTSIINITEQSKKIEDYSFVELILLIIKKIISIFIK
jgi:hypothetical protein